MVENSYSGMGPDCPGRLELQMRWVLEGNLANMAAQIAGFRVRM